MNIPEGEFFWIDNKKHRAAAAAGHPEYTQAGTIGSKEDSGVVESIHSGEKEIELRPDSLQQAGETPDYLGDKLCNGGQHNTRHHATNRA